MGYTPTIALLFGPVSGAGTHGGGAFWSVLLMLVGGWVLVRTWIYYLKRPQDVKLPVADLFWVSAIAAVFVIVGIWELTLAVANH